MFQHARVATLLNAAIRCRKGLECQSDFWRFVMKKRRCSLSAAVLFLLFSLSAATAWSQTSSNPPPAAAPSPPATAPAAAPAASPGAPAANPAPPPSAPVQRSQEDLEKLVAPIALYPDPLLAALLPASTFPLEIVQAARLVKDTNNIPQVDAQPWDENVKAIARLPDVIAQMNDNIAWTSDLGDAFINQPKDVMNAIQALRAKAQESGALKSSPQQEVVVTNTVVTNIVEQQPVYVTNEVIQVEPANPQVMYVPQYNPTVVYGSPAYAYPGYAYPPGPAPGSVAAASVISFGAGLAVGALINNNCDWNDGGCYHGGYRSDVNVNVNRNYNANVNRNYNANVNRNYNNANVNRNYNNANVNRGQKWQPNQSQVDRANAARSSAQNSAARGWGSTPAGAPRTGQVATATRQPNPSRPATPTGRTAPTPAQSANRQAAAQQRSAFSGGNAAQTAQARSRGAASRGGGGARGGGGGGRRR